MWHGPASHTLAVPIEVRPRSKRQDAVKPKATMWHGPASHAPPSVPPLPLPQVKRQNLEDSRPKATMWHGLESLGLASTPTESSVLRKRQGPVGGRPKASMRHDPASNAPPELSSPFTVVEKRASPTQLDMIPFLGMKPIPGLASPAALLPVSPFEPKPSTEKLDGTMSAISAASTAPPQSVEWEHFVEPSAI
ncbi:hypothetical protein EG328_003749 [Venturia inaequalis]|nr:hypothetical protein EG328_003749 [Venturia inaequalis]RDI80564.1 hypothetical protein Vi05172_g9420 [Venturia inaequalis]